MCVWRLADIQGTCYAGVRPPMPATRESIWRGSLAGSEGNTWCPCAPLRCCRAEHKPSAWSPPAGRPACALGNLKLSAQRAFRRHQTCRRGATLVELPARPEFPVFEWSPACDALRCWRLPAYCPPSTPPRDTWVTECALALARGALAAPSSFGGMIRRACAPWWAPLPRRCRPMNGPAPGAACGMCSSHGRLHMGRQTATTAGVFLRRGGDGALPVPRAFADQDIDVMHLDFAVRWLWLGSPIFGAHALCRC
jgi:hypothetical protein